MTRVYLTVDVECAEERMRGGQLQPPLGYDLRVWGRFANQRRELGLAMMLAELRRCGLVATFFVEPFGSSYFGAQGLADVCHALRAAGQDVQLHAHPIQQRADWSSKGEQPPADQMAAYDVEAQSKLLADGLEILQKAGARPQELVAFRAGHFAANNDTWRAMASTGLSVSSNLNLSYLSRGCAIDWPTPANALFSASDDVWELPVSNFVEAGGGYRHLQVTAISFAEMRHYLETAARLQIPEVTVVTHCFEFFFVDDPGAKLGHANWINQHRWRQLCSYLRDNRDELQVESVGALARRLRAGAAETLSVFPGIETVPAGRRSLRYARLAEQALKRVSARLRGPSAGAQSG